MTNFISHQSYMGVESHYHKIGLYEEDICSKIEIIIDPVFGQETSKVSCFPLYCKWDPILRTLHQLIQLEPLIHNITRHEIDMTLFAAYSTIFTILHLVIMAICNQQRQVPIVKFNGENYLTYIPSKWQVYQNLYVNKLEFKFRTIHPSGVLLLMSGNALSGIAQQKNVLGVHLVHGYLR